MMADMTVREARIFIVKACEDGKPFGLKNVERVRFIPAAACQLLPRCPRPDVCAYAQTVVGEGSDGRFEIKRRSAI